MSSPESISSSSSYDSDLDTSYRNRHGPGCRQPEMSRDSTSQRPLPELPLPRPPPSRPGPTSTSVSTTSHSGQMLAAILRDRPLPRPSPSAEQTSDERRRSIIALDRKRRLTNPASYEEGRRRTNSGGWNDRRPSHDALRMDGPSSPRRHASSDPNLNRPLPEVIDLTTPSPSPPQPQTPRPERPSRNSSENARRYVVPQWQPDYEVNECPICQRPFTWMFRRHHCRKCGRVVCNDCSPHRITIPRQSIVQHPGPEIFASPSDPVNRRISVGSSEDELYDDPSRSRRYSTSMQLEGGEKVRLCNPCVPDPQPDPFPSYAPLIPERPLRGSSLDAGARQVLNMGPPPTTDTRPRGLTTGAGHPIRNVGMGGNPYLHQYHRSMGAAPPMYSHSDPRNVGLPLPGSYRGPSPPSRYRMHMSPPILGPSPFLGPSSRVSVYRSKGSPADTE